MEENINNPGIGPKKNPLIQKIMAGKKIIYIIIIIVIFFAAIGGGIYWHMQKQNNPAPASQNGSTDTANTQDKTKEATTPPVSTAPATKSVTLSYTDALKIYANKRIQFSISSNYCSLIPANSVFKKGTKIMLDNRNPKQITVYMDGQPNYIKAYGFKIITLTTSAKLPHTIRIDCETGKNNGSILLQQ